jgi:drug/metabolite transporter (DMT)-like permease
VGIGMTVAGVAWVVAAPPGRNSWQIPAGASFAEGLLMGLISSLTASVGMVLSHMAFMPAAGEAPVEAFPTALVRVFAGLAVTFLLVACTRRLPMVAKSFSDRPAMVIVLAGTAVGPVLGMWTSMVALKLNPAGVGVALISTSPIMMVPLAYIFYHERPTVRTIAGTALTVLGIAVLMLR